MMHRHTVDSLRAFEEDIAAIYNRAEIRAPIHLSKNNEEQLIRIFENFKEGDWVFSSWRNHYHGLLAGIPPSEVKRQILAGRSMTICSPKHRFFSSAIVSGCCPIAMGVAWQIKHEGRKERVWLFLGEMAAMSGIATECVKYARQHELPLIVVVEDNGKSVCTNTYEAWNGHNINFAADYYYKYNLGYPHAGAGVRINF